MISPPTFSDAERQEARRELARLDRLPRFRMTTLAGRWALNLLLRTAEVFGPRGSGPKPEQRSVSALGRDVDVRIFRPDGLATGVAIQFHGGGWTIGNARMSDQENRKLVTGTGLAVVSVDYRLAVHHDLKELVADCVAAALWVLDHAFDEFGTRRVVLRGDSAGGHLGALTLLALRDRHKRVDEIRGALLSFGLYDFSGTASVRAAGNEVLILHGPTIRATLEKLTPGLTEEERRDPRLSPLFADLAGLPPALFVVGDADVLLEDNQRMASRWQDATGNAELLIVPESPHAFYRLDTAIARKTEAYVMSWLRQQAKE